MPGVRGINYLQLRFEETELNIDDVVKFNTETRKRPCFVFGVIVEIRKSRDKNTTEYKLNTKHGRLEKYLPRGRLELQKDRTAALVKIPANTKETCIVSMKTVAEKERESSLSKAPQQKYK